MIKVEQLTKKYAGVTGIDQISFEVGKGEIVGFLGPNGAGKTTTMRILASYMPASSGRATVAGFDVFSESLKARRHLGYLPESVPLYHDMGLILNVLQSLYVGACCVLLAPGTFMQRPMTWLPIGVKATRTPSTPKVAGSPSREVLSSLTRSK